jgi:hypothetical protein
MRNPAAGLTVILPCAGSGTRLGLNRPKELFEILPGVCLIDLSLAHIRAVLPTNDIKVAVVIRPHKEEVVDHVRRVLPGIKVEAVFFNDSYYEWPGSVFSARETFSNHNLVLLPDSILNVGKNTVNNEMGPICLDDRGSPLIKLAADALSVHKVVFGWVKCSHPRVLKKVGALRVEEDIVTAFQDKPVDSFEKYIGFWGCYAFRKEVGKSLYHFLVGSVRHRPVSLEEQPFHPAGAIPLHSYRDLGTWPVIRQFKQDYSHPNKI